MYLFVNGAETGKLATEFDPTTTLLETTLAVDTILRLIPLTYIGICLAGLSLNPMIQIWLILLLDLQTASDFDF